MKKFFSFLNIIFVIQLVVVGLVVTGVLPRTVILGLAAVLSLYALLADLDDAVVFFAKSIPLFVAIPLTSNFDSLNTWRILSGIIFLRWALCREGREVLWQGFIVFIKRPLFFLKNHKFIATASILLILALISVTQAESHLSALKRIVYFINLSLVGIVAYDLMKRAGQFSRRLIVNLSIPVIIVTLVGFAQLIATYFVNIFQFAEFSANKLELGLFGTAWSEISIRANTWFAYFGDQLSLRMFSLFPDSHSFPIFILLGLPAVFYLSLRNKVEKYAGSFKKMLLTRGSLLVVFVPTIYLASILSGTRGIWAASLGALLVIIYVNILFEMNPGIHFEKRNIFNYLAAYIALFFILFAVAYPIFASSQFRVTKADSAIMAKRVHSIIDTTETSNSQRIQIWKSSIGSVIKKPLAGVGIGNFPVVLGQDIALAKAGSSAHNLYLNIAAEMGIPALLVAAYFLWLLLSKLFHDFTKNGVGDIDIYRATALIYIPWVLFYLLTDIAIFDERAFLMFVLTIALVLGMKEGSRAQFNEQ